MKRREGPEERAGASGTAGDGVRAPSERAGFAADGGSRRTYGRGASATPDGWRTRLRGFGAPAAVAGSGLAVVLAVLVSTVIPFRGADRHEGGAGGGTGHPLHRARPAAHPTASRSASRSDALDAAAPTPQKCEDGSDPAASLRPSRASGPAVDRIRGRGEHGELIVGVDQNSYLWGYRDPNSGHFRGFDIDLVHAIAKDLLGPRPRIVYKAIPTEQRVPAVRNGDVDMIVRTMTIKCVRNVAFSTAYFSAGQRLVVPKDHARVTGFDASMRGKRLCYANGSVAATLMGERKYRRLGAKYINVPNQLDCLVRMQLGKVDATLTDSTLGAGQIAQDPMVHLVGRPLTAESYGVAMKSTDKDLVRRVNNVLRNYTAGGAHSQWRTSYDKWLGHHIMGTDGGKDMSPPKPAYRN